MSTPSCLAYSSSSAIWSMTSHRSSPSRAAIDWRDATPNATRRSSASMSFTGSTDAQRRGIHDRAMRSRDPLAAIGSAPDRIADGSQAAYTRSQNWSMNQPCSSCHVCCSSSRPTFMLE